MTILSLDGRLEAMGVFDDDQSRESAEPQEFSKQRDRSSESPGQRGVEEAENSQEGDVDSDFIGIRSVGAPVESIADSSDEDDENDVASGVNAAGGDSATEPYYVQRSSAITRTALQGDKPLRNRLFGRDFSVADSMFPDELEPKVTNQVYPLTEGDYWHLRRLEQKTRYYRRSLPVGMAVLVAIALVGVIFFNFGPIQLLAFFAAFYWILGLYLKSGVVRGLLMVYKSDLDREPTTDPER